MKIKTILFSLVLLPIIGAPFAQVYTSLAKAQLNPNSVKHLAPSDFDPTADGYVLTEFPNLEILDLSVAKNVSIVPLGFKKLSSLKYLNISHTEIGLLYPYIKKLPNLEVIVAISSSLRAKELNKISSKLGIEVITLQEDIPSIFEAPQASNNELDPLNTTALPENNSLTNNSSPTTSSIQPQQSVPQNEEEANENFSYKVYSIKEVNEQNAHSVRNVYVSFFGGDLERLIEFIPQLENLEKLRMGGEFSNFPEIPSAINSLQKLKYLEIITKDITDLPALKLPELDTLVLPPLSAIPTWVKKHQLKSLTIYAELAQIDWSLIPSTELEELKIICNYSTQTSGSSVSAPSIAGINQCKHLTSFELEMIRPEKRSIRVNSFELPDEIGELTELKKMIIKGVTISNNVDAISSLTKLEELYIRPKEIPASFKDLTNLKSFQNIHWLGEGISNSSIEGIKEVLPYWTQLEKLLICPKEGSIDLSSCKQIKKVFIDFGQSKSSSEITLPVDNNIQELSLKFSKVGVREWSINSKSLTSLHLFCQDQKNSLPKDLMAYKEQLTELRVYNTADPIDFSKEDFSNVSYFVVK